MGANKDAGINANAMKDRNVVLDLHMVANVNPCINEYASTENACFANRSITPDLTVVPYPCVFPDADSRFDFSCWMYKHDGRNTLYQAIVDDRGKSLIEVDRESNLYASVAGSITLSKAYTNAKNIVKVSKLCFDGK